MNIYGSAEGEQTTAGGENTYYTSEGDLQGDSSKEQTSVEFVPEEQSTEKADVPAVLGYFNTGVNRNPKGLSSFFGGFFNFLEPETRKVVRSSHYQPQSYSHFSSNNMRQVVYHPVRAATRRIFNNYPNKNINEIPSGSSHVTKPLGLVLVEVSYHNCALGKGAPIEDERVLISWTRTPVRVFGGAILKSVPAFCV